MDFWAQVWDAAKWAIPFIVTYLVWVHREIITLRQTVTGTVQSLQHHNDTQSVVSAQLADLRVMVARVEEQIRALRDERRGNE